MNDIASNPVKKAQLGNKLQARREKKLERQAEQIAQRNGRLGAVIEKQLDKERKVEESRSRWKEDEISAVSDIQVVFNDTTKLQAEIADEVMSSDKWAKTIQKMQLSTRDKSILERTQILKSERTDDKTVVSLGCSKDDVEFIQSAQKAINTAMSEISGRHIEVVSVIVEKASNSPKALQQQVYVRREAEAKNALIMDNGLQMLIEEFGGEITKVIPVAYSEAKQ